MLHGLSATSVYYLDVDQLRLQCATRNLSTDGGVRQLRQRLADFVKGNAMGGVDMQRAKHLYPKLNGYGDNGQRSLKL